MTMQEHDELDKLAADTFASFENEFFPADCRAAIRKALQSVHNAAVNKTIETVAKEFEKDAENVEFKMIMLGIAEKIRSLKVTL